MLTRSELKARILSDVLCPYEETDFTPISLYEATLWLADLWRDQELSDIPEDQRIPHDTVPEVFAEAWNEICLDHVRAEMTCDEVPVVSAFYGRKSGDIILIQRYGNDDYGALWYDTYSVRGSLLDIMREVKEEL